MKLKKSKMISRLAVAMLTLGIIGSLILNKMKVEKERNVRLNDSELILSLEPEAFIPHGWGWTYRMDVIEVLKGNLEETSLEMDLSMADEEILHLKTDENGQVNMAFIKRMNQEGTLPAGVSGFLDQNGSSWEMVLIY